jgi:hypothetical protein
MSLPGANGRCSVIRGKYAEARVSDPVEALIIDLLEWIGPGGRPYAEFMEAWRTSCPRLPVWEEANTRGYIEREHSVQGGARVSLSPLGLDTLERHRRSTTSMQSQFNADSGTGTA